MNPKEKLAALYAEADELNKKGDALQSEDVARIPVLKAEIETAQSDIKKQDDAAKLLSSLRAPAPTGPQPVGDIREQQGGSFGERFIKSAEYRAFRAAEPGPVEGRPVNFKASNLGHFNVILKTDPAPVSSTVGGGPLATPVRLPGVTDLTYRYPTRLLDVISRGTTSSPFVQYRALTAITNAAAIVPEGTTKPLSSLTFSLTNALAYTYADGFKVTNQELADDGIMANLLDTTLRSNLAHKIEDILLNGTGTNQPFGILNTTGVLAQAFATDIPTTLRNAITLLQTTSLTDVEAIVLNPTDAQSLSLLKDSQGRYIGNGPFGTLPNVIWQVPFIVSTKIAVGTALIGAFSSIQLLDLDPLSVQAFTQNEDDARKNLTYIRAEQRSLLLLREPAKIAVATLHA